MNSHTSSKLFRQRSFSSIPSRQFSVADVISQRQSVILDQKRRKEEQKSMVMVKDVEISKLRRNLQTAVSTALHERLENSKTKEDIVTHTHHKLYLENKIKTLDKQNKHLKAMLIDRDTQVKTLSDSVAVYSDKCQDLEQNLKVKIDELQKKECLYGEIERYKLLLKDINPLKQRIMTVEEQIRAEKIKKKQAQKKLKITEKEKEQLKVELSTVKPREQELRQRIAYFQRVNLDMERKMEDFNRRQNEYIKNITNLKTNLTRVTADRNHYKTVFEQTREKFEKKVEDYNVLEQQYNSRESIISTLTQQLEVEKEKAEDLKTQIEDTTLFFKQQGEQNEYLKNRNKLLQEVELELRRVIEGHVKISEQVNLTIVKNFEQIKKLKTTIQAYQSQIKDVQQKFQKFNNLFNQGSEKGYSQVREGFYGVMRINSQNAIKIKQMDAEFTQKLMIMGEQRDLIVRSQQIRSIQPPNDQNQFLSIFHEKTQAMILLQNSNDQLLKIKKQYQAKIQQLYGQIQKEKKQMTLLKLKTAEMFRAKKDLDQARKKMERYQEMIQQQNQVAVDMQSQMSVLREKNAQINQKYFVLELEKKNLEVKLQELNDVIKELDADVLQKNKQINQKNSHLIQDSLQKIDSAIKSLSFYFNCAFCNELPLTPVTLALCGHTYCTKCKEAYAQSCYECDTGMPIEKVFQNRFLKDASGKYKFLMMVLKELKANFIEKN